MSLEPLPETGLGYGFADAPSGATDICLSSSEPSFQHSRDLGFPRKIPKSDDAFYN